MAAVIRMPALAAGATEAAVQSWLVAVGDRVSVGQEIVEIETEKAVVEYEAEQEGVVAAILVDAGAAAAVGSPIAVLAAEGESAEDAVAAAGVTSSSSSSSSASAPAPTSSGAAETGADAVPALAPTAPPEPETAPEQAPASAPSGAPGGRSETASPRSASEATASEATAQEEATAEPEHGATAVGDGVDGGSRLFASPLVRKIAREKGIELSGISGTGPNGRIVRRDLDALPASPPAPAPTVPAPTAPANVPSAPGSAAHGAAYTDIPHTGMRRAIARRLTESTTTVPHFFLSADCVVDEVLELRARVNERSDVKISVNDFVLKAVAAAMLDVPEANAIWTEDATRRFTGVDIGVAVSIPGGLVTPVVRGVEGLTLSGISRTVRDLAERARAGRIKQQELEGGSFAVSNLGMYGTSRFSAIINPPHSGILAVGAAEKRPVVGADGELTTATVMTVTLSADHRVLDGALAAQWLAAFTDRIQHPLSLLV
jgi:pyruvate dehydrogenase E2 component (dihydrolipoamide acetyltransferase)